MQSVRSFRETPLFCASRPAFSGLLAPAGRNEAHLNLPLSVSPLPASTMLSSSGSARGHVPLAPSRSGVAAPVPLRRPRRKLLPARLQSGQHAGGSFDSAEELDYNLAKELEAVAQPDKYAAVAKHLNLLYDASEVRARAALCCGTCGALSKGAPSALAPWFGRPLPLKLPASPFRLQRNKVESCQPCRGSGEQECNWCHGTGGIWTAGCASFEYWALWVCSMPTNSVLAACRCHDDWRHALLQRWRLHSMPRLPRHGERRCCCCAVAQPFPTRGCPSYWCSRCFHAACRAHASAHTAAALVNAQLG
jgi:hypothetical protein